MVSICLGEGIKMVSNNLVIIGNGFDLHHELKTTFWDFVNSGEICKKTLQGLLRMQDAGIKCNTCLTKNSASWTDFEKLYWEVSTEASENKQIEDYNKLMACFTEEFTRYLKRIQNQYKHEVCRNDNIQKVLADANVILDFNYTNTLKDFYDIKKDVKHIKIHGSVDDDNIVIGFANTKSLDAYYLNQLVDKICDGENMGQLFHYVEGEEVEKWRGEKLWLRIVSQFKKEFRDCTENDIKGLYEWFNNGKLRRMYQGYGGYRLPNGYQYIFYDKDICKNIELPKFPAKSRNVRQFLENNKVPGLIDLQGVFENNLNITVMGHALKCDVDIFQQIHLLCQYHNRNVARVTLFKRHDYDLSKEQLSEEIQGENQTLTRNARLLFSPLSMEEKYY